MGLLMVVPSVTLVSPTCSWKAPVLVRGKQQHLISSSPAKVKVGFRAACFFNPQQPPILKEALKEPVAFVGGIFAGLLRLDLTEEPLKEWVARTVEASGISEEVMSKSGVGEEEEEEMPQQIEIE